MFLKIIVWLLFPFSFCPSETSLTQVKDKNVKDKKEKVKKDKKEVELHVLVANQLSWKPEAWKAIDRGSTASVGFIK